MDKKILKIAMSVLDAVRSRFPETNEFIDSTLKEECEKERMTADEVINLLQVLKQNVSLDKYFFVFRLGTKVFIFFVYRYGKV